MGFLLDGWVLMPERFHFLIRPEPAESTPAASLAGRLTADLFPPPFFS
jgi:hypothetical protein